VHSRVTDFGCVDCCGSRKFARDYSSRRAEFLKNVQSIVLDDALVEPTDLPLWSQYEQTQSSLQAQGMYGQGFRYVRARLTQIPNCAVDLHAFRVEERSLLGRLHGLVCESSHDGGQYSPLRAASPSRCASPLRFAFESPTRGDESPMRFGSPARRVLITALSSAGSDSSTPSTPVKSLPSCSPASTPSSSQTPAIPSMTLGHLRYLFDADTLCKYVLMALQCQVLPTAVDASLLALSQRRNLPQV
jgi:hypothetical protein